MKKPPHQEIEASTTPEVGVQKQIERTIRELYRPSLNSEADWDDGAKVISQIAYRLVSAHLAALREVDDNAFDAGVEAAALYHDGEAERIRQICQPLTLKQIDAIGDHDEAAIAIRGLKRST